ncbi:hypothetical protein J2S41_004536 [Catenuloplanes atrovinosus]|uniref:Uncharacterized protein n=2 Tax=Catenuloplanes atrovinosus TaxID=137266 RepID=A0AAE3YSR7_9ACTN|nr:hypothetical protein [Catenuloplanes atrovinosus]
MMVMMSATVTVSGALAQSWAGELQAVLEKGKGPGESVSPVQVERDAGLTVAVIALVFAGVDTAKTIWDWWHEQRPKQAEVVVTVVLADGTRVEVSGVERAELDGIVQRALNRR